MTEEITEGSLSSEKTSIEVSVKHSEKILVARASTWDVALAEISVGMLKARISSYANESYTYDKQSMKWTISLDKEKGKAGDRIALALLFHYPQRLSRNALIASTGIKSDSLTTYLSKSKPEISNNIDENGEGVTLNERGLHWATKTLESL